MSSNEFILHLDTNRTPEELTERLREYQPWGHLVTFSNGVSTADLERRTPFNEYTLNKVKTIEAVIPMETLKVGRVLDIGSNTGHNAIYMASRYDMRPTGIDVTQRHLDVSNMLSDMAGISGDFRMGDAETYTEEAAFDLVMHFGTLYHLPNPLLSLQSTWKNLKPGGWLALETQTYEHADDPNICFFMHMHNNDKTNFWALSTHVLETWLAFLGFVDITILKKVTMDILGPGMARTILVARKPEL